MKVRKYETMLVHWHLPVSCGREQKDIILVNNLLTNTDHGVVGRNIWQEQSQCACTNENRITVPTVTTVSIKLSEHNETGKLA